MKAQCVWSTGTRGGKKGQVCEISVSLPLFPALLMQFSGKSITGWMNLLALPQHYTKKEHSQILFRIFKF